jgi:cell wall-associated NlpC family hydrolase
MAFGAIAAGSAGCAAHAPRASALLDRARAWGDPPATLRDWQVVGFASRQVGKRYCWGGIGPECYDCSGLVKEAWASVGIRLPHSSDAIPDAVPEVPLTDVRPGDILWWPGHLAIYAGHGWSIEALDRRDGVVVRAVRDPARAFRPRG